MSGLSKWIAILLLAVVALPVAAQSVETTDADPVKAASKEVLDKAKDEVGKVREEVDADERAKEAAAGILQPIYRVAESFETFSAFYWVAFCIMITGLVSFALQLVLGKLVGLAKGGFSLTEIFSDGLGAVISLVGLVLTTQAATENSAFTSSAFAVLSATIVGAVAGFIFYVWGQRQELQAIKGRSAAKE